MKKLSLILVALAFSCNSSQKSVTDSPEPQESPSNPEVFASTITEEELKTHLYIYASDDFEGRDTGAPGQKKAVAYLKEYYENLEVPAAKGNGDYFQEVPLEVDKVPMGTVTFGDTSYPVGEDIITFSEVEGQFDEVVFLGYGIETEDYSDYTRDITGKIVLIKSGEPRNEDGTYVLSGTNEKSIWSNMSEALGKKRELAVKKGARGILYYDPGNFGRYKRYFDFMRTNSSGRMQLAAENANDFLILLNEKSAKGLFPEIAQKNSAETLEARVQLEIKSANEKIASENVIAVLKGTTKANEYVVISSHLDHIGVTADGRINNGADDDGSGTVAMLEIAEAFKKASEAGNGPQRTIVFLHVTGEEKGLLGSKYYTDYAPVFPLESTVANLNIDMIGRIDPKRTGHRNYVYLIGSDKLSSELHELSEEVNTKYTQLELDYTYNDENDPNRFYYRSDHYNFAKNNIPIIFYFNGTHEDYHQPGDTPDKINYDLLQNRTRLIFHTAWELANRPNKVTVDKMAK